MKSLPTNTSQNIQQNVEDYPEQEQEVTTYENTHTNQDYDDPTLVLTPLENKRGEFLLEDGYEPFRLEMTPPDLHKQNSSQSNKKRETSPRPKYRFVKIF